MVGNPHPCRLAQLIRRDDRREFFSSDSGRIVTGARNREYGSTLNYDPQLTHRAPSYQWPQYIYPPLSSSTPAHPLTPPSHLTMSSLDEKEHRRGSASKKPSVRDSDSTTEKKSAEHDTVEAAPAAKAEELTPVGFTELFRSVSCSLCSSGASVLNPVFP